MPPESTMSSSSTQLQPAMSPITFILEFARPIAPLVDNGQRRVEDAWQARGRTPAAHVGETTITFLLPL